MSDPQRDLAQAVLTDKQFDVWEKHERQHMSLHALELHLGISRSAVKDRLKSARRRIKAAQAAQREAA